MICPHCGKAALLERYLNVSPVTVLDGKTDAPPRQELADLLCPACGSLWYALPHETSESACRRITNEEPRP